jgi:hypothetical protein
VAIEAKYEEQLRFFTVVSPSLTPGGRGNHGRAKRGWCHRPDEDGIPKYARSRRCAGGDRPAPVIGNVAVFGSKQAGDREAANSSTGGRWTQPAAEDGGYCEAKAPGAEESSPQQDRWHGSSQAVCTTRLSLDQMELVEPAC